MVAKRTLDKKDKQRKNKLELEVASVKMVKKQARNILPYLSLPAEIFNKAEALFHFEQDDRESLDDERGTLL